jgi:phosphoglucosamine mutase
MQRKFFGTDGIRGRVGKPPITPDLVLKLGWAAGRTLVSEDGRGAATGLAS